MRPQSPQSERHTTPILCSRSSKNKINKFTNLFLYSVHVQWLAPICTFRFDDLFIENEFIPPLLSLGYDMFQACLNSQATFSLIILFS